MLSNDQVARKTWVRPVLDELSVGATATGPAFFTNERITSRGEPIGPEKS